MDTEKPVIIKWLEDQKKEIIFKTNKCVSSN